VHPLGRLVVDNSACEGNFHIKSDLEDFHNYYSMPDQVKKWDKFVSELAQRPVWSYSPYGDAERSGCEPILVSEFGNWGLPKLPEETPWWYERDFGGRDVTRPAGLLDRFQQYHFNALFADYNALAEETQWHQFISLKYEIESMRRHAEIQGYVVTGMTDINWEVNGLLDMWRNPKVFAAELKKLQQSDLVLLDNSKQSFIGGEKVELQILVSHYSSRELKGTRVRWMTDAGAGGQFEISEAIASGVVAGLQKISFIAPDFSAASPEHLHLEIRTRQGALLAENDYNLFIFPKPQPAMQVALCFHDSMGTMPELSNGLRQAGYQINSSLSPEKMVISSQMDETVERHLADGGKTILLLNSEAGFSSRVPLKVLQRAGCELDGRWFSNFNWVRTDRAPFDQLDFGKILGFESAKVAPEYVIDGLTPAQFPNALAGVTYGWLAKNMAMAVPFKWNTGEALATTFRFDEYGSDPYATHLLDGFIKALASEKLEAVHFDRESVEIA
jgi:hypothetical protein